MIKLGVEIKEPKTNMTKEKINRPTFRALKRLIKLRNLKTQRE